MSIDFLDISLFGLYGVFLTIVFGILYSLIGSYLISIMGTIAILPIFMGFYKKPADEYLQTLEAKITPQQIKELENKATIGFLLCDITEYAGSDCLKYLNYIEETLLLIESKEKEKSQIQKNLENREKAKESQ